MKKRLLIIPLAASILACQNSNKVPTFTVEGTFTNTGANKIFLAEFPFGSQERTIVDTANLDSKGHFTLSTPSKGEGIYQLFVENGPGLMLINDADKLELNADARQLDHYTVKGGKANADMKQLYADFLVADNQFRSKRMIADSLYREKNADSAFNVARQQTDAAVKGVQHVLGNFIKNQPNGSAVYFALGIARAYYSTEEWQTLLEGSTKRFTQHPGLALLKAQVAQENANMNKQGIALIGKPVPDITMPDTSGKMLSVGSFKGKWLLVDFWASWCQPCRMENPNVVAAYKQFKNKNFTILGVSLDKTKAAWTKAIQQDGLTWNHISDLKYWDSQAVTTYGFNSIPFNMLISPEGKVVATDLRGEELAKTLGEYVK